VAVELFSNKLANEMVLKTALLEPVAYKIDLTLPFYQDRLGTNAGETRRFLQWSIARAGDPDTHFRPVSGWGEGGLPPFLHYAPNVFARRNGAGRKETKRFFFFFAMPFYYSYNVLKKPNICQDRLGVTTGVGTVELKKTRLFRRLRGLQLCEHHADIQD
jgi:hypothetical protein